MSDATTHSSRPSHAANGETHGTRAERREARRLRRELARNLEHRPALALADARDFPQRHPYVTASLLVAGGAVLGAVATRALFPSRGALEQLLRIVARSVAR